MDGGFSWGLARQERKTTVIPVKRGNGGENSWSSSSRVCSWSTAGQEFPLAFGVPFPPSLCSFLQAVDKFPPYKSVTWAGTNGLKGKEPGLDGRRMTVGRCWGVYCRARREIPH